MDLVAEPIGGLLVVRVMDSRIDAASAIQFKERMRELTHGGQGRVMLDLSRVLFLDSSGLGAVVAVMKLLGLDRRLELAGLTPTVEKVFRLTRMDGIFSIHPLAPEAGHPLAPEVGLPRAPVAGHAPAPETGGAGLRDAG